MVVMYRLNGGQAIAVSVDDADAFLLTGEAAVFYGRIVNPTAPVGFNLDPPKIVVGTTLRDATAGEIAAFATAAAADAVTLRRLRAVALFDTDERLRVILNGIVGVLVDELNLIRARTSNTANPAQPMPDRTLAQARQALVNAINAGTYD